MNLTLPAFAVLITAVFGAGTLTVAVLNAIVGKGGRRADVADKLTESADRIIGRLEGELGRLDEIQAKCDDCKTRLTLAEMRIQDAEDARRKMQVVLRTVVRVFDSHDPDAVNEAIAAARELT